MNVEYFKHYSGHLNREMEMKHYGHTGKVMVVFPTSGGRFYEYEDFRMIDAISSFIEKGKLQVYTIDSIDAESWLSYNPNLNLCLWMARCFEEYLISEFVPFVKHNDTRFDSFIATGCSMGAFHAVSFSLKHPDVFDQTIALSDIYDARFFTGEYYGNQRVYENSPVDYLLQMNDSWFIDLYRNNC